MKLVANEMSLILEKLEKDVRIFLKQDKNILIKNKNKSSLNSLSEEEITHDDGDSRWSIFLDRLLYYLPYSREECRRKLIDLMNDYYNGNPTVVSIL